MIIHWSLLGIKDWSPSKTNDIVFITFLLFCIKYSTFNFKQERLIHWLYWMVTHYGRLETKKWYWLLSSEISHGIAPHPHSYAITNRWALGWDRSLRASTYRTVPFAEVTANFLRPRKKQTSPNTELMLVLTAISSHCWNSHQGCLKAFSMKQTYILSGNCICCGPMHRFMVRLFTKKKCKPDER